MPEQWEESNLNYAANQLQEPYTGSGSDQVPIKQLGSRASKSMCQWKPGNWQVPLAFHWTLLQLSLKWWLWCWNTCITFKWALQFIGREIQFMSDMLLKDILSADKTRMSFEKDGICMKRLTLYSTKLLLNLLLSFHQAQAELKVIFHIIFGEGFQQNKVDGSFLGGCVAC